MEFWIFAFDSERKIPILRLNKKGSEVRVRNASNYLLSPGALACALGTESTNRATNPGKGWHSIYLKYPHFKQCGF